MRLSLLPFIQRPLAAITLSCSLLAAVPVQAGFLPEVRVAWDRNPESEVTSYVVQYGLLPGAPSQQVEAGNSTSATLANLTPGATYFCTVTARDKNGNTSKPSREIAISVPAIR